MAKDTVTLRLQGEIPLNLFAEAMQNLSGLLNALSEEVVGPKNNIEWEITQLQYGSAITEIRGMQAEADTVARVVRAYGIVGESMQLGRAIPYSDEVSRYAFAITSVVNGHISAVEFATDEFTARIDKPPAIEESNEPKQPSIGVVTGSIVTLTTRPQLRAGLTNQLFDRIVYCYLEDNNQAELAKRYWRFPVSITGMILRDPITDRPLEVRQIRSIEPLEKAQPYSYRQAIGALPWHEGDEPAEETIRRIRDAS